MGTNDNVNNPMMQGALEQAPSLQQKESKPAPRGLTSLIREFYKGNSDIDALLDAAGTMENPEDVDAVASQGLSPLVASRNEAVRATRINDLMDLRA